MRIDVDSLGNAWACNDQKAIYRFTGQAWVQIPGQALDIAVGADDSVFVVGSDAVQGGHGIHKFSHISGKWQKYPGGAARISVDIYGNPWIINATNDIFRWNHDKWEKLPGKGLDIACGSTGEVFVTTT